MSGSPGSATGWWSSGHPATVTTDPSRATRREGSDRASSQAGACAPSTRDAVEAVLASTHDAPATVTVRQHGVTGRPVVGSTTWCTGASPRSQWRLAIPELASPPETIETAAGASGSPQMSATPTTNPPSGADRTARSPPKETSTPQPSRLEMASADRSAAHALAVAPRSRMVPAGMATVRLIGSRATDCQPVTGHAAGSVPSTPPDTRAKSWS